MSISWSWVSISWGMVNSMVGYNWSSMDNRGSMVNSMGSMDNWGVVGHSNGWSNVWGKMTSRDNSTSMGDGSVVSYIRGGESGGEAEEGGDNKSLKI